MEDEAILLLATRLAKAVRASRLAPDQYRAALSITCSLLEMDRLDAITERTFQDIGRHARDTAIVMKKFGLKENE